MLILSFTGTDWILPAWNREYGNPNYQISGDVFSVLLFVYPLNAILDLISIYITRHLLSLLLKSEQLEYIIKMFLFDIFVGLILIFIPILTIGIPQGMSDVILGLKDLKSFFPLFLSGKEISAQIGVTVAISVTPIFPTIFHALYLLVLIVLKICSPVLVRPISFIISRSVEHEKVILAVIGTSLLFFSQFAGIIQKIL